MTDTPPVPTVTAYTDADPCPRVEIVVSTMPDDADTLTVWRSYGSTREPVRGARGRSVSGPDRWDRADETAAAVWDSGIDPNQLAVYMAARGQVTRPSTRPAAATTTRRRVSGSGTSGRKPASRSSAASRSVGSASAKRGR